MKKLLVELVVVVVAFGKKKQRFWGCWDIGLDTELGDWHTITLKWLINKPGYSDTILKGTDLITSKTGPQETYVDHLPPIPGCENPVVEVSQKKLM